MNPVIKLEQFREGPYIKAPSFCPYASSSNTGLTDSGSTKIVHPSLCPLCKICRFVPELDSSRGLPPTQQEQEAFATYITNTNLKLSASISGQSLYLSKGDRIPLVVLISFSALKDMLQATVSEDVRRQELLGLYTTYEQPVCHVLGCPVYFSRKLTKSAVQVVGEIEWK